MSNKRWKEVLLSSGIPLEHDVIKTLEELCIDRPTEYKYERLNELGIPITFSVDVHGSKIYFDSNIYLELFIECKYRHDNTKWVFTPTNYDPYYCDSKKTLIVLDHLAGSLMDMEKLTNSLYMYDACEKGIELLPKESNPKSIKESIQQLRYAVIEEVMDALEHQVDKLLGNPSPIFVLAPIIVTTAELWRINPRNSMEDIRLAENLEDVATQKDIIILHDEPDNEARRHSKKKFNDRFNSNQIEQMDERFYLYGLHNFKFFVDYFSSHYPSMFTIINYRKFKQVISSFLSYFERNDLFRS